MENAQLRFGCPTSADVKLWLMGPNEEKYERNPVHLHSVILERSEFFEVKLSDQSSNKLPEITVITSHGFHDYLKCIQLMYGERVNFSNVEECLAILSVASELLVDDCINKCMQYLEAVRWTAEQKTQMREVLSSLGLEASADLAARLHTEDDEHIIFVERMVTEMVSLIQGHHQVTKNRKIAEEYITGILEGNSSREVVEVCGRVLLREFKSCIGSGNFLGMRSLSKFIQYCKGEILEAAFRAFVEDPELTKHIKELAWETYQQCCEDAFYTIIWFMEATGEGKMNISRASRISFLITWLPIMTKLCFGELLKFAEFEKAVLNIVESLLLVDKERICAVWAKVYNDYNIDIATPFTLFKDLLDAHDKYTPKQ
ncbi:hypothetical protein SUGI_1012560 [Cryptomeria japonica]|uniref:BTB/POZ domain-containing protein At3g50780-like n=1 Tax=Cryptomeria japonica TaxID=3369 RepID=UPI002414B293|nr:BTB/POZ domain-containing protein At3g50780-like [Cryptomeria japonica]GLJ47954.1 hypothetical protein SUGI_1012560 [Cryptomeria japonica]